MTKARFDINAKLSSGTSSDQIPDMLQALLAERFKLEVHRETKDQNVYALVVGKGGPNSRRPTSNRIPTRLLPWGRTAGRGP
jgi:uncharacterized protein (TIGR03435 family)